MKAFPFDHGMQPLRIAKIIDVGCGALLDILAHSPCLLPLEFSFQSLKEAFRDNMVTAVSFSAHGNGKA
ncbi:hypothetical protein AD951_06365 [Acetobacter malorum]|uniref:Uncharacterized protein n=1 Tax=Acetobacter malorum TaxID=178901 RepID=A0A149UNL8_9PROT|nr:hypothetical protein [Acetobacter malorum]KXV69488.1 hypothetical protein AD951_06365 [Acetobacter malorum]